MKLTASGRVYDTLVDSAEMTYDTKMHRQISPEGAFCRNLIV